MVRWIEIGVASSLVALCGCGADLGQDSYDHSQGQHLRVVEVLGSAIREADAFVELRNDGQLRLDGHHYTLSIGHRTPRPLQPRVLPGSTDALTPDEPPTIQPGQLALIVDQTMDDEHLRRLACENPIASDVDAMAAKNPMVASSLKLASAVRCLPVYTLGGAYQSLGAALEKSNEMRLLRGEEVHDEIHGFWSYAPPNYAVERVSDEGHDVRLSPLGSTPGARNYFELDGYRPIRVLASSPWRIGRRIMDLQALAASQPDEATAAAAEIDALLGGELPPNPMAHAFNELLDSATQRARGALYQLNDMLAVEGLTRTAKRGLDVHLTTDGEFMDDEGYRESHDALRDEGVTIQYDLDENGENRSGTMHDKFLVIDGHTTFTGSYNPVVDKPFRIHADNALLIQSREVAALHEQELDIMEAGHFGVSKRDHGRAGGDRFVDGSRVTVRFSPGLTYSQRKRRADALKAGADPVAACDAVVPSSGKYSIQDRYRTLSPCGGPLDVLLTEIARATSSIYFVSFSLSLDDMVDVFIERHASGVDLKGVVDPTVSTRPQVDALLDAGGDVRYTPNSDPDCPSYITPKSACPTNPNKVWLHHKFVVIDYGTDHPVVITGSHNLSEAAEKKNDDALVVIRDRAVAESYYRIFRETFDHPQTLGARRKTSDLPALAITQVVPSLDPAVPSEVELSNFDSQAVSVKGLQLWNRERSISLPRIELGPGERRRVRIDSSGAADGETADLVLNISGGPFITPHHGLVLRHGDGRWVATYDPYLAEQNLPDGVAVPKGLNAQSWQYDEAQLAALRMQLLGHNTTPSAPIPTWEPAGFYSNWLDEHDVTNAGLILMQSAAAPWHPEPTP
ncbi:MAG: phospholipase D-like domain-containing protein [Polyangiaceae bacterium]